MACIALVGVTEYLAWKDLRIQQALLNMTQADNNTATDATDTGGTPSGDAVSGNDTDNDTAGDETPSATQSGVQTVPDLTAIAAQNSDCIGWVLVADTNISYPVMHTPADEEYYLRKDFYGGYSIAGTIFASASSSTSPRTDNIILYGHNMSNGTMFANLLNYQSQAYWQWHQTLQFDTLDAAQTYEIVYAFVVDIAAEDHFAFYEFTTAETEQAYCDFIESCAAASLYDTGTTPVYGDQLITLVTCKGYSTTERMVVVAKAVA